MKKLLKFIMCFIIILGLCDCTSKDNEIFDKNIYFNYYEQEIPEFSTYYNENEAISEIALSDNYRNEISKIDEHTTNKFFFADKDTDLKYCVRYDVKGYDKFAVVNLHISKLKIIENGILYRLEFDEIEGLSKEELSWNFFVTSEKIYRIWCREEEFMKFNTKNEIINNSYIVCQNNEISKNWLEVNAGDHNLIRADENLRYSYYVYTDDYDNTKYYERLFWEEGKGLMYCLSGRDAKAEEREFIRIYE